MSEVENNQETNGATNGDVPEIELIIKEKYMLVNEPVENTNENNFSISVGDLYKIIDEKENILQTNELFKPKLYNQTINEYKIVNIVKDLSPQKDFLLNHENVSTNEEHILMLTHYDNQNYNFAFVAPDIQDTSTITDHISSIPDQIYSKSCSTNTIDSSVYINHRNRVPFSEKHETTEMTPSTDSCDNLTTMVAEACEGIFEDIENDLRTFKLEDTEKSSCTKIAPIVDTSIFKNNSKRKKRSPNSEEVKLATNAVMEGRMSLGEAARRYSVVRSTVSSRVTKHPKYKRRKPNIQLDELINNKLKAGLQISEIARSLHIPKSTVHLHKTKLKNSGQLPSVWVRNGNRDIVDHGVQDRLLQAYRGHIVNGMSVSFAAKFFSLPTSTLWRYIKRRKNELKNSANEESSNGESNEYLNDSLQSVHNVQNEPLRNNLHKPLPPFEDLKNKCDRNKQVNMQPALTPTSPYLVTNIEKEEELFEQSMINELLE